MIEKTLAKEPAKETDLWIPFVDFMWQRASYPEVCSGITGVCDDFHNMATSVAKLRYFYRDRALLGHGTAYSFAATEIEYLVTLARGVFDLLQEICAALWNRRIQLLDAEADRRRKGRTLPDTFSKLVLRDKRDLKTQAEIQEKYGLTSGLAAEYARHGPFFSALRDVRDTIVHAGGRSPTIYLTERGFCVSRDAAAFRGFSVWTDNHRYNNDLFSLLPWLAHVIFHTIDACSSIVATFAKEIQFPPEIAPGYRVFVRGYNNDALLKLIRIARGENSGWEEEPPTERI